MDTGSTITLIRPGTLPDTLDQLSADWMPTAIQLTTVTGEKAGMRARKMVTFRVGDQELRHECWLADIQDQCIIGLDLLARCGACVDVAGKTITIGAETRALQSGAEKKSRACTSTQNYTETPTISRLTSVPKARRWKRKRSPRPTPPSATSELSPTYEPLVRRRTWVQNASSRTDAPRADRRRKRKTQVGRCTAGPTHVEQRALQAVAVQATAAWIADQGEAAYDGPAPVTADAQAGRKRRRRATGQGEQVCPFSEDSEPLSETDEESSGAEDADPIGCRAWYEDIRQEQRDYYGMNWGYQSETDRCQSAEESSYETD